MAESSFVLMSEPRIRWVGTAAAVIVIALYFGTGVFDHGIWSPAEPAFAGVVWNMFQVFTAVAIAPWVFALYNEGGLHYLRVVFFDNTFGRFFAISHLERFTFGPLDDAFTVERGHPRYAYLLALFQRALPWSLIFFAGLIRSFRHRGVDDFKFFLKVTIISVPVLLTFSASRPQSYIDPLLFIMLLIVSEFLRDLFFIAGSVTRFERALFNINLAVVALPVAIAPIVLGIYLGKPIFFGLSLLIGLAFALLAWRFNGAYRGPSYVYGIASLETLSGFITIMTVMPSLEALKSHAAFFDEIRDQIEGGEVYTTVLDDRRLPLITYNLNRRVQIGRDREGILQLLEGKAKVGVIFSRADYLKAEKYLDQIPHTIISRSHGTKQFVWVNNL